MNIFYLDEDPILAAQYSCNAHVVKMILETAQLLCTAFPKEISPYKHTHLNHPSAIWARESLQNFTWLLNYGLALVYEYTHRYGKTHKSSAVIDWCLDNIKLASFDTELPFKHPPKCMPEDCKVESTVESYRNYYIKHKQHIARWGIREVPYWFKFESK